MPWVFFDQAAYLFSLEIEVTRDQISFLPMSRLICCRKQNEQLSYYIPFVLKSNNFQEPTSLSGVFDSATRPADQPSCLSSNVLRSGHFLTFWFVTLKLDGVELDPPIDHLLLIEASTLKREQFFLERISSFTPLGSMLLDPAPY